MAAIIPTYTGHEQRICIRMYMKYRRKQTDTKIVAADTLRLHFLAMMDPVQRQVDAHTD